MAPLRSLAFVFALAFAAFAAAPAAADTCHVPRRIDDCGTYMCNRTTGHCALCHTHADCYYRSQECVSGRCLNTHLYDRDPIKVVAAAFAGVAICTIGVLAGVGGGGAMTPTYAGILGMPLQLAVIASLSSIFGQGLLNVPYLLPQRYPGGPRRPLINYPTLVLWYPITAAGTLIGAHWKHAVPDWFRNIVLIAISLLVSIRVVFQAFKARQLEKQQQMSDAHEAHFAAQAEQQHDTSAVIDPHQQGLLAPDAPSSTAQSQEPSAICMPPGTDPTASSGSASTPGMRINATRQARASRASRASGRRSSIRRSSVYSADAEGISLLRDALRTGDNMSDSTSSSEDEDGKPQLPRFPLPEIISLLFIVAVVSLSRWGSRTSECNGLTYWMSLLAGGVVLFILFGVWHARLWWVRRKVRSGELPEHFMQAEPTMKTLLVFPLLSAGAGFCSSTVGIGGGTLINPLLIEAGLLPEEASATGGMFTFLIALGSTVSALTEDSSESLSPLWLGFFSFVGFVSTVAGRMLLLPYFKRKGATSVIVAALALSLILTFVAVGAYGGVSFGQMVRYDVPFAFGNQCPASPPHVGGAHHHHHTHH